MKIINIVLLFFVTTVAVANTDSRDTFPTYDSIAWSRAFSGQSDIRWNSYQYRDPYNLGNNQALKGIESSAFYKALRAQIIGTLPPGGGFTTAQNGLTATGSVIELGGANPLLHNTTIRGNSFDFKVDSSSAININTLGGAAFGSLSLGRLLTTPSELKHQTTATGLYGAFVADCDDNTGAHGQDPPNSTAAFSGIKYIGGTFGYEAGFRTVVPGDTMYLKGSRDGLFAKGIDTVTALIDTTLLNLVWNPLTKEVLLDTSDVVATVQGKHVQGLACGLPTGCQLNYVGGGGAITITAAASKVTYFKLRLRIDINSAPSPFTFGVTLARGTVALNIAAPSAIYPFTATNISPVANNYPTTITAPPTSSGTLGYLYNIEGFLQGGTGTATMTFYVATTSGILSVRGGDVIIEGYE
ncbi:MAG: hypothetical protein WAS72_05825 [Saprospiraceae bacterium]